MGNGVEEAQGNSVSWNEHFEVKIVRLQKVKTKTESRLSKKNKKKGGTERGPSAQKHELQ